MDKISLVDKIKLAANHTFNQAYKFWSGSYVKAILNGDVDNSDLHCKELNSRFQTNDDFGEETRCVVLYKGEKNFFTVMTARSYTQINNSIKYMINNYHNYSKLQCHSFVESIVLITHNDEEINVFDMINMLVKHAEEPKLYDIVHLHDKKCQDIKSLKIVHYKDMDYCEMVLDFDEMKNNDISRLLSLV